MYSRLTAFHREGAKAYKPGLETTLKLADAFGNPHKRCKTIHIAGTNGKGSTAHTLAAVLQKAGFHTGLYTSPHLVDFGERIRVDGKMIEPEAVVGFIERYKALQLDVEPSFFELTTIMAFDYFARQGVEIAVVECGLGGRLDSTNIITPELSVITNISIDHAALLGETPSAIAREKAGIIKPETPVIIGEADDESVRDVFYETAQRKHAPIIFADESDFSHNNNVYTLPPYKNIEGELTGEYQWLNARSVLVACKELHIIEDAVREGFAHVCELTGLMGRWTEIKRKPLTIIDTGHNPGAWIYLKPRLEAMPRPLHIVIGFVSDKDISHIIEYLPRDAHYYFVEASTPRAAKSEDVAKKAREHGLTGIAFHDVISGYTTAQADAVEDGGSVFVGGSNFVVGDLLAALGK